MKIYLAIWPQKDQLRAMNGAKNPHILTSYWNRKGMTKDFDKYFKGLKDKKK